MIRHKKTFVTWCVTAVLLILPLAAPAVDNDAPAEEVKVKSSTESMAVDAILVRPLGLVSTIGGAAVFLVFSPFSVMGGNTQETWDQLVAEPAKFTFQRPLGHFEEEGDK